MWGRQRGDDQSPAPVRPIARAVRLLLALQAICFVGAGLHHAHDIWQGGWLPYDQFPLPVNVFWTSLVALDPLAAGLLVWRPRMGVIAALFIMLADVGVNSYMEYRFWFAGWHGDASLQLQSLFLGFVAGTAPMVWWSEGRASFAIVIGATSEVADAEQSAAADRPRE